MKSKKENTPFKNIIGYEEEKKEILNIITLLNNYEVYEKQGVHIPRGLIFQGPPGTGKTLFAKSIADECNYKFFTTYNFELEEDSLKNLKKIFSEAETYSKKNNVPALIYIDEIDKLFLLNRYGELEDSESRDTVRFLLQKLDENKTKNRILIIASTNAYETIPEPLLRSGRFDKKFLIDLPDFESREKILEFYINKHPLFENINLKRLALKTDGMSGADIKTLINNTLLEYITTKDKLELDDFIKIINEMHFETIGKKWKSNKRALEVLAHEVGHSLVACALIGTCGTVSAIKYGDVAGATTLDDLDLYDEDDQMSIDLTYNDIINNIMISLGGKAGEEVFLKQLSVGLAGDFRAIKDYIWVLTANACFGFDKASSYRATGNDDKTSAKYNKFTCKFISKLYKKVLRIVKKNKVLGLYLIDEVHKNNDVLSETEIVKRIELFNKDKSLYKKYKKLSVEDLYSKC